MEWASSTTSPFDLDDDDGGHSWNNRTVTMSDVNSSFPPKPPSSRASLWGSGQAQIPLYAIILLLAVVGNSLVIVTLMQNKRMRTVTNVFLLNLALSDLLLGVFCMPFTLAGTLLRQFVFGQAMCKAIPYLQAVSVAVSSWTLVTISVERYFAICQPLRSRRWQTRSHAYKMIVIVWASAFAVMIPIAVLSVLQPRQSGKMKCREAWPEVWMEQAFNIALDIVLLVIPLIVMIIMYSLITHTLHKGITLENISRESTVQSSYIVNGNSLSRGDNETDPSLQELTSGESASSIREIRQTYSQLRQHTQAKNLANKKRIIKMLFAVVLEFFICWTPLHVVNTISLFDPAAVYGGLGVAGISLCHLMTYASSCCNPITYCFLNSSFRRAFLNVFGCRFKKNRCDEEVTSVSMVQTSKHYCSQD